MTKKKGDTDLNQEQRRNHVRLLMTRFHSEGKQITGIAVQNELSKFPKPILVSLETIYQDIKAVNSKNTFVRDIAQYNYSQMCENSFHNYSWIYEEARKNYDKSWTLNRTITRKDEDGNVTEEVVETGELASGKQGFLRVMKEAQREMDNLREGRMMKVSVALINNEFVQLKTELENANKKLEEYATSKKV